MAVIVSLLGVLVVAIGLVGLVKPSRLMDLVETWRGPKRFWAAIIVRLIMGCLLLVAAPTCRLPVLVRAVGGIAIVAAVALWILGQHRLDALIAWWRTRPAWIRLSASLAVAFGLLLLFAGAEIMPR